MLTHTGLVRSQNEDICAVAPELGAYVICDGMGGAAGGEIASRLAACTFLESLAASASSLAPSSSPSRLQSAVLAANRAVLDEAQRHPELTGMGATLVALLHVRAPAADRRAAPRLTGTRFTTPPDLFLANVGDSRCYRLRAGSLVQLSHDHSFVEEQLRAGHINAEQAASSPMRNYITRAIGPHKQLEPDLQSYRTLPGDVYLLCSDGLTRELDDPTLAAILRHQLPAIPQAQPELLNACRALIAAANDRGGHDNITVLLLAIN